LRARAGAHAEGEGEGEVLSKAEPKAEGHLDGSRRRDEYE